VVVVVMRGMRGAWLSGRASEETVLRTVVMARTPGGSPGMMSTVMAVVVA
jgi:hypothetical protein